eukprot:gene18834-20729_t
MASFSTSLLFVDTFYHDEAQEEMHLDLIGFPRSVSIHEIRVIPHGSRVHAEIKDKFGETSPRSFKLETFIKNLNKPDATVFEKLGTLDYVEGETFQLITNSVLATNVVLVRGWYSRLTVCLYGAFTDVVLEHNQAPPPPPMDSNLMSMQQHPMDMMRAIKPPTVPLEDYELDRQMKVPDVNQNDESNRVDKQIKPEVKDKTTDDSSKSKSKDFDKKGKEDAQEKDKEGSDSARDSDAKFTNETTELKSQDKNSKEMDSPQAGVDTLFEPLSPEDAEFFEILNDAGNDEIGYEDIESDEDNFDDFDFEESTDLSNFQDLDLYGSDDTWMSVSVSFNPYQCYLSTLESFEPLGLFPFDLAVRDAATAKQDIESFTETKQLQNLIEKFKDTPRNAKWVAILEEVSSLLPNALVTTTLKLSFDEGDDLKVLLDWACHAIDFNEAMKLPIGINIRQLKAGIKIVGHLGRCNEKMSQFMMQVGIQQKLLTLLKTDHMASSIKLLIIQALDSTIDMAIGMENFLGWNLKTDDKTEQDKKSSMYEELMMYLLTDPTVRVVTAIKCLLRKVHFYESLANFQQIAERISSNVSPLQQEAEAVIKMDEDEVKKEDGDTVTQKQEDIEQVDNLLSQDEIDILITSLADIYKIMESSQELMAQPTLKDFPTSVKIIESSLNSCDPTVFSFLRKRRFLESLLVVVSSPAFCDPVLFSAIRDMLFYLLDNEKGLLFLASEPNTLNGLIRVLTQSSESDNHYSEAPPLKDLLSDPNAADNCAAHHIGLLLIYHLQSLQGIDQLITSAKNGIAANEMDNADNLSTLHTLYSMTFTSIGKAAVTSVLSQRDNLKCLIPFVEQSDESEGKIRRSVSSKYASVLLLLTLQLSDDVTALEKFGTKLLNVPKKEADTMLAELGHFLAPLNRIIKINVNAIANLVEYIKSELETFKTSPSSPRGIFTALRLLKHICITPKRMSQVVQKDQKWNQCTIQLLAANAMDIFIQLLGKVGERLVTPWRQNQPFSNHQCSVLVSLSVPLLQLIHKMMVELIDTGTVEFKDSRLLHGVFVLHTILCSKPAAGILYTTIQKVQSEIVSILLKFTSVNAPESQDALKMSPWYLMLKELIQYTSSKPQAFQSGVTLLSELLPVPFPVQSVQDLSPEEMETLRNHRLLWTVYIGAVANEIESMLKSLICSCCNSLQHGLSKLCLQLVDLGALTALSTVRILCDVLSDLLRRKDCTDDENETSEDKSDEKPKQPDKRYISRVVSLLSSICSQPGGKLAFLQLIRGSKGNEEAEFPNLLRSLLDIFSSSSDSTSSVNLLDNIMSLLLYICDCEISMTILDEPMTIQDFVNCLPNVEMLEELCQELLSIIASHTHSYQLIAHAMRILMSYTDHDVGMQIFKRCLPDMKLSLNKALTRIDNDISNKDTQADAIRFLSTLFAFVQLLLAPSSTEAIEKEQSSIIYPQSNRNTHLSLAALKDVLSNDQSSDDNMLSKIEQALKETSKEDVRITSLLEAVTAFNLKLLSEDVHVGDVEDAAEDLQIPNADSLKVLYVKRVSQLTTLINDQRIASMLWFLSPPSEDVAIDADMIKADLEQIAEKYCPGFNLKEEVEKGFLTTDDDHAKRAKRSRRKYDPLVHGKGNQVDDLKRQRLDVSYLQRGGSTRGTRGGFRGRGRGFGRGHVDLFRSRKQNTSRPPSMHVDDFIMMESSADSGNADTPSKSSYAPVREANSEPRFTAGFNATQGRWASPNQASFRREGQHPQMPRGGFDNWGVSRTPVQGTFSPQYPHEPSFDRGGSSWNPQIPSQYRAPRESQSPYQRSGNLRGGYWAGPKTKEDNRFFAGGGFGSYRQNQGNDRGGFNNRHFRTFTR